MAKQKEPIEPRFVDNAKDRMMMLSFMEKLKDVLLFILVAAVLTWIVVAVL
ncbi:hypothetical protein KEM09_14380 [Carboxylicivirga mesophila]|uniref:Uncharacterized protein n=1 Tax=Carboxylicivirga mesophila TaxID=1166478 RepID=A0ABS5KC89_9BACT|nr:hypothetical protein [Carboxylicivirga mesophila]MBS2212601.1 hypothetical protein [Carboxylicivirga mesophila]